MEELKEKIGRLQENFSKIIKKLNLPSKEAEISALEKESAESGFWDDPEEAQRKMKRLSALKEEINLIEKLKQKIEDVNQVLGSPEGEELVEDLRKEIQIIEEELGKLEVKTFLSGKYDSSEAIVSIHAGQGGTEAMDWAQMLQRMYWRYAEKEGWRVEVIDSTPGEEAGIKSTTLFISGPYAYGYLKKEAGTHRLVRQSPFNADRLRQTSFALVEVLPRIEETSEIEIKDEEVEFESFRSGGHGGQNVNKVATAVRLKHKPTGITVTSQSQRFQEQNRKIALEILRGKLLQIEEEKKLTEKRKLKGEHVLASWGNQIRSYVLHPYKMVKDLRTRLESSNPQSVLDGDLGGFINAELKELD